MCLTAKHQNRMQVCNNSHIRYIHVRFHVVAVIVNY